MYELQVGEVECREREEQGIISRNFMLCGVMEGGRRQEEGGR